MATKRPLSEVYDFEDGDENSEEFLDDSLVRIMCSILQFFQQLPAINLKT